MLSNLSNLHCEVVKGLAREVSRRLYVFLLRRAAKVHVSCFIPIRMKFGIPGMLLNQTACYLPSPRDRCRIMLSFGPAFFSRR